jgi:hypothetical protein
MPGTCEGRELMTDVLKALRSFTEDYEEYRRKGSTTDCPLKKGPIVLRLAPVEESDA